MGRNANWPCFGGSIGGDDLWNQKNLSNGVLRLGNGGVARKLCLEERIWPPLPKKG